jgi:hypothetical protein
MRLNSRMLPSDRLKLEKLSLKLPSSSGTSLSEEDEDLNTTVLKSLQCAASSCHRYLYPPIKQCRFVFYLLTQTHAQTHISYAITHPHSHKYDAIYTTFFYKELLRKLICPKKCTHSLIVNIFGTKWHVVTILAR